MRSSLTAIEPKPSPRFDIDQLCRGPDGGHCLSSPVSFDRPLRSGPRHCGQSAGPLGEAFGAAASFAILAANGAPPSRTENQMKRKAAVKASDRVNNRLCFIQISLSPQKINLVVTDKKEGWSVKLTP